MNWHNRFTEWLYVHADAATTVAKGLFAFAVILCLLAFCGCATLRPMSHKGVALYACSTPVQVVPSGNRHVDAATWAAVHAWNERLGWRAFTAEESGAKLYVVVSPGALPTWARVVYGSPNSCSTVIQVRVYTGSLLAAKRPSLPWVMSHELGHVLGLPHSPHRGDLMHKYVPKARFGNLGRVTDEEVALIEALQQCETTRRVCTVDKLLEQQ